MRLTTPEVILWYSALLLEFVVFALALRRRLYSHLPVFTGYLTFLIARETSMYWVYRIAGYNSRLAFYSFWITQALLLTGRAASIGELAWRASATYPGFRVVLKWLLSGVALILLLGAGWVAFQNSAHLPSFVLSLERDIELTAAIVLLSLLALTIRYQIHLQAPQRFVAVGLFEYSLVQVLNNAISRQWFQSYFHWWDGIRIASFHVALVIWLVALAKPLTPPETPQAVDLQPIREFMRQGTNVIHDLSARLSRFRRKL